jgi:hypothetical protein
MMWAIFWATFSKIHLVTLGATHPIRMRNGVAPGIKQKAKSGLCHAHYVLVLYWQDGDRKRKKSHLDKIRIPFPLFRINARQAYSGDRLSSADRLHRLFFCKKN